MNQIPYQPLISPNKNDDVVREGQMCDRSASTRCCVGRHTTPSYLCIQSPTKGLGCQNKEERGQRITLLNPTGSLEKAPGPAIYQHRKPAVGEVIQNKENETIVKTKLAEELP